MKLPQSLLAIIIKSITIILPSTPAVPIILDLSVRYHIALLVAIMPLTSLLAAQLPTALSRGPTDHSPLPALVHGSARFVPQRFINLRATFERCGAPIIYVLTNTVKYIYIYIYILYIYNIYILKRSSFDSFQQYFYGWDR